MMDLADSSCESCALERRLLLLQVVDKRLEMHLVFLNSKVLDGLLFTLIFISPKSGNVNHLDVFAVLLLNIYLSKATLHVSKSTETIRWSSVRLIKL